ncbi:FkbM family methyltransferase [Antarcticibacterium flavum]|uniref:FkbM family methyltransferase n=1 Tax=Antarcticibacterium flavum TaxID=2058175 RepID=A0A5B7X727_9FLAO|nr:MULTISPECIES: FkbM family methyltransferase [Antarcticibacterium]MCM4161415.1 FkbM family methyltransferase [Antarcticibacterium sp. W02-3]QCY70562.1 FkbM family methyltransferase [Antarcticibacterium flavum]
MIKKILIRLGVKNLIGLLKISKNLQSEGWHLSLKKNSALDSNGDELPWYTYPFIHFLKQRLNKDLVVFEYGSGNSTIWYSKRVKQVVSVEHNVEWFNKIKSRVSNSSNVDYIFKNLGSGEYQNEILNYNNAFHIVVIDGLQRVQCSLNTLGALKEDGVIIWDNSDRSEYEEGYNFLLSQGFKRIDFWGIGPLNYYSWSTSVFYKDGNCLNI